MTNIPKTMVPPANHPPIAYRLFQRHQECKGCGRVHHYSQVAAMLPLRAGYSHAMCYTKLDIAFNVPIRVENVTETTPFCHECWKPGMLSGLPTPRPQPSTIKPSWVGQGEAKKPKTAAPKAKKVYTIDDLDID